MTGRDGPQQRVRVNHLIRITPIRVIGADNEQIGVIETPEALRMAEALGLDLVEISPEARPPVCKIMDYGKYKYETSKREQKNRSASKSTEMKEVRLGRSAKIDEHDVQIRIEQSRRFLIAGHKVLITQRFKGREMAHREIGLERLKRVADALGDVSKVESTPRWMGTSASIILAPDKVKVEAVRRKLEKEKKAELASKAPSKPQVETPATATASGVAHAAPAPSA
ncbi:MAG: translation initiation factor IF-3 [Phycisphaerae bacterium]|nr:translation initiation factor IF-3 [Phycisphaerae bacterium]